MIPREPIVVVPLAAFALALVLAGCSKDSPQRADPVAAPVASSAPEKTVDTLAAVCSEIRPSARVLVRAANRAADAYTPATRKRFAESYEAFDAAFDEARESLPADEYDDFNELTSITIRLAVHIETDRSSAAASDEFRKAAEKAAANAGGVLAPEEIGSLSPTTQAVVEEIADVCGWES